jgi:hypothetical protein
MDSKWTGARQQIGVSRNPEILYSALFPEAHLPHMAKYVLHLSVIAGNIRGCIAALKYSLL